MKCVAIIQARMGSSRLPGKVLLPAAGKPLLAHLIERAARAKHLDAIMVATTMGREDDAIERLCNWLKVGCFRGSADDVLGRVTAATRASGAGLHIELHGDGPLADWRVIDQAVELFQSGGADLVTNSLTVTYPPGLEVWVYPTALLERVECEATAPAYRESPALYLSEHADWFRLRNFEAPTALHAPDTYLEVDEPVDFEMLRTIIEALYPSDPAFTTEDVLRWLAAHPEVAERNRHVERRWKTCRMSE